MNIGERIRELRISKLMTQSDLAGDHITRNMLSCIENGTANPSLSTILYIAGRLGVPAGFLLAEEGDEIVYRKIGSLSNIKRAYTQGDLRGCRSLCIAACPEPDDEINLLLANCDVGIAVEEFWDGKLRSACRYFDEALSYAEKTVYPTETVVLTAGVYFRYMERISQTLYSDMLDGEATLSCRAQTPVSAYLDAWDACVAGEWERVDAYLSTADAESFETTHIRALGLMSNGDYRAAERMLLQRLKAETPLKPVSLYTVLCELEICCREIEDFKGAYNYANEKVALLEQLLKEI